MPSNASNGNLKIMAVVKALIACAFVGAALYCMVTGTEVPDRFWELFLLVVGSYFGFSAALYHQSARTNDKRTIALVNALIEQQLRSYDAARKRE